MIPDVASALNVRADLHLAVGELEATLDADGHRLIVTTDDAAALLARAAESWPAALGSVPALRRAVGQFARQLDDVGLSAEVDTGRGPVLVLGHGCASRLGRLVLGTERARLGRPRAVLPLAAGLARMSSAASRRASYAAGGVALAALLGTAAARRRPSTATAGPAEP